MSSGGGGGRVSEGTCEWAFVGEGMCEWGMCEWGCECGVKAAEMCKCGECKWGMRECGAEGGG